MRCLLAAAICLAILSSCASSPPPAPPDEPCSSQDRDRTDGGLGGTGLTEPECED